jgi:hypothetical protein
MKREMINVFKALSDPVRGTFSIRYAACLKQ